MFYEVTMFCLYFVIVVCMAMVFLVSFMNSIEKGREPKDRLCDLITGVLVFIIFSIIIKMGGRLH